MDFNNLKQYEYENILQRMLDRIPDDIDKRQGSVIFDALAPSAKEMSKMYLDIADAYKDCFFITADDVYLDMRAEELGLFRKKATPAKIKAEFLGATNERIQVAVGERFSIINKSLIFVVIEINADKTHNLVCETAGDFNVSTSDKLSITTGAQNIAVINILSVVSPGSDDETDESLKERFRQLWADGVYSGNKAQYKKWAEETEGVGKAVVLPLSNDGVATPNAVTVYITNANLEEADTTLIKKAQDKLDPNSAGLGDGVAPIGSVVYVKSGKKTIINVAATIETSLTDLATIKAEAETAIKMHFKNYVFTGGKITYFDVGAILVKVSNVTSVKSLTLNTAQSDVSVDFNSIPFLNLALTKLV